MAGWVRTYVRQTSQLYPGGNVREFLEVGFQTDDGGFAGSVTVPNTTEWNTVAADAIDVQVAAYMTLPAGG